MRNGWLIERAQGWVTKREGRVAKSVGWVAKREGRMAKREGWVAQLVQCLLVTISSRGSNPDLPEKS